MKYSFKDLKSMDRDEILDALTCLIDESASDLMDTDAVSSEMASTNASGFTTDTIEIRRDSLSVEATLITCEVDIQIAGEQDEDKPFSGDIINVSARYTITSDETDKWSEVDAERNLDEPDELDD